MCVNACKKTVPKRSMQERSMQLPKRGVKDPSNITFTYKESMQLLDMPPQLPDTSTTIVFKTVSS